MFKLVKEGRGLWSVVENGRTTFHGSFPEVSEALESIGVSRDEIAIAEEEMAIHHHNFADFGVNNTLTFTGRREEQ